MFPGVAAPKPGGGQQAGPEPAEAEAVSKLIGPLVPEFTSEDIYALAEQIKESTGG